VRRLVRWVRRLVLMVLLVCIGLGAPVIYVETMCQGTAVATPYDAVIGPDHHRPETRTLMTYPEWHIVHAYEDYAEVLRTGDPHDYGFLRGISGFWGSLCALTSAASIHGVVDGGTKQMVYVIGVSFTAELALKAAYEETIGRIATMLRGRNRTPLDELSATQAAEYANFLQQTPWYKWPFTQDVQDLNTQASDGFRDTERRIALGLEYRAKAAYADVIAQAVAQVGADELTLRMIVNGGDQSTLGAYDGVRIIQERSEGTEIEAPRYRELTHLLVEMANDGWDIVEIAGNDDIMFTALSEDPRVTDALYSRARQGFGGHRHLIRLPVTDLAARLRAMKDSPLRLEHIHDY